MRRDFEALGLKGARPQWGVAILAGVSFACCLLPNLGVDMVMGMAVLAGVSFARYLLPNLGADMTTPGWKPTPH